MANRSVIVDNNTWNNTHIATVGRAMASPEKTAWQVYRDLDVEYVLVVFGGFIGYPSDDINKFLWMVRIGGGVFPDIKEKDYLTAQGGYTVDGGAGRGLLNSLMYRLSYYRCVATFVCVGCSRLNHSSVCGPSSGHVLLSQVCRCSNHGHWQAWLR